MDYDTIANNWSLWRQYVDTQGVMTKSEFDDLSIEERYQIVVKCFGEENYE